MSIAAGVRVRRALDHPAWRWFGPVSTVLLAAALRLWGLGHPHTLVFDETYYVKDAYTLWNLGYEAAWPEDANADFEAGRVDGYGTDPSFVVHPPLGKLLIGVGLAVFGAENSVGWRIGTAVAGILIVALVCVAAHLLFRSPLVTTIAGALMAVDGHAIVLSRVALLDNFLTLFCLLGVVAMVLDRQHSRHRLRRWLVVRSRGSRDWGPVLWWRPWLVAAAVCFGLASAVKWSGLYFLAAFAVYSVVVDAAARRRHGIPFWLSGSLLRQAPVNFLLTVPVAAVAHLLTWAGWFRTEGGYYRSWTTEPGNAWGGAFAWVPPDLQSFWHYQVAAYNFHIGLTAPHSYQADAWSWLLMLRPTSFYYRGDIPAGEGCPAQECASLITSLGNPLIWWLGAAALIYAGYRFFWRRSWQHGVVLLGVAAGYVPWLFYPERTMFQFYAIVFEPYLVLALAAALGAVAGSGRFGGGRLVAVILALIAGVSGYFLPVWTGMMMPELFVHSHFWLPGWR